MVGKRKGGGGGGRKPRGGGGGDGGGGGGRRRPGDRRQPDRSAPREPDDGVNVSDIYEADDPAAEGANRPGRYDPVDNYEYELPSDFEDEEINEDEAFNEEDKRLYSDWFPISDEEEDVVDGEEAADVDGGQSSGAGLLDSEEEEGDDDDEEGDEADDMFADWGEGAPEGSGDEEEEEGAGGEGDEEDGAAHEQMLAGITGKRGPSKQSMVLSEAYPEDEYNLNPSTTTAGAPSSGLSVSKLLAGLSGVGGKGLGGARKELEKLERSAGPVDAPLPSNIAARAERIAAYDDTKRDVTKWQPLVKANREAPTLKFDGPRDSLPRAAVSTASLAATFRPATGLEEEVAAMLEAAGASDGRAVEETEEALALKKLTVEEAQERRAKLAQMRALLFYHETKAKHLKKIKSKAYHRKLKKSAKHKAGLGGEEGEEGEEVMRLEAEKAAVDRAAERISLKHRNTSRWARRALKRGQMVMDEGTKEAIAEQLRLGQELRQKAERMGRPAGSDSDGGGGGDSSTDASDDEGGAYGGRRTTAAARQAAMDILESSGLPDGEVPAKGLFALPFMQRAMERKRAEADGAARATLEEIAAEEALASGAVKDADAAEPVPEGGHAGRMSFGAPSAHAGIRGGDGEDDDAEDGGDGVGYGYGLESDSDGEGGDQLAAEEEAAAGGGEPVADKRRRRSRGKKQAATAGPGGGATVSSLPRASLAVPEAAGKTPHARAFEAPPSGAAKRGGAGPVPAVSVAGQAGGKAPSAPVEGGASFVKAAKFGGAKAGFVFKMGPKGLGYYPDGSGSTGKKGGKKRGGGRGGRGAQAGSAAADAGTVMLSAEGAANGKPRNQQDLIKMAFAGDDVEAEFAEAKRAEVEAELPAVETPGLVPGWGMWAGQQREPRWMKEERAKAEQARKRAAAERADAKKGAVVITEKWDKKASKYAVESVPHGFGSVELYEAAVRHPLGEEYNTDLAFRNMTRPAVLKTSGVLIDPIKFCQPAGSKRKDTAGPRGARDLVRQARLRHKI
eukprot:jgi/Tetstr1/424135/TSEL_014744.t1